MISDLCEKFITAKSWEEQAKQARLTAEFELLAALGPLKPEGTNKFSDSRFKVTVTTKLNREIDLDKYEALSLPEPLRFVDYVAKLNLTKFRHIEAVDPSLVTACVTTKPAKPNIKVEEVI